MNTLSIKLIKRTTDFAYCIWLPKYVKVRGKKIIAHHHTLLGNIHPLKIPPLYPINTIL